MNVERVKYIIWAADMQRAVDFYVRTWTGLSFQVPDVIAGAAEIVAAGGQLVREPQPEDGEPPHLAMCVDPEGNEIMLTRKRQP
jgi:predicted enzyme related to lactoylglutathione lyase